MATQNIEESRSVRKQRHFLDVIHGFDTAMLVTRTDDGAMRSRPLMVAECRDDGTLYFATSAESGKVHELERDPHVNVTLQGERQYASLSGRGEILRDRALVDRLWTETWKVWFPAGKDDPHLCILAVHPHSAELWDNSGARGVRYFLKAAGAYLTGRRPRPSEDEYARFGPGEMTSLKSNGRRGRGAWPALAAGLSGAVALTVAHEAARRFLPHAPRMDRVAGRGIARLLGAAGAGRPDSSTLYLSALGGDLLANSLYYAAGFVGGPRRAWTRGLLLGTVAGLGAVTLPRRLGIQPPRRARKPSSHRMTVAWYALAGLAAAGCYRTLAGRAQR
jgi:general stress protein 26